MPLALHLLAGGVPASPGDFSSVADFGPFKPGLAGAELERTLDSLDATRDESYPQTTWVFRRDDGAKGRILLDPSGALASVVFERDIAEPEAMKPIFAELVARYGPPTWDHRNRKTWRNGTVNLAAWWTWVGNGGVRATECWTGLPRFCARGAPSLTLGESLEDVKKDLACSHSPMEETMEGESKVLRVDQPCRTITALFERSGSGWSLSRVVVASKEHLDRTAVEGRFHDAEEYAGKPDQVTGGRGSPEIHLWRGPTASLRLTARPGPDHAFAFEESWTLPTEQAPWP